MNLLANQVSSNFTSVCSCCPRNMHFLFNVCKAFTLLQYHDCFSEQLFDMLKKLKQYYFEIVFFTRSDLTSTTRGRHW